MVCGLVVVSRKMGEKGEEREERERGIEGYISGEMLIVIFGFVGDEREAVRDVGCLPDSLGCVVWLL